MESLDLKVFPTPSTRGRQAFAAPCLRTLGALGLSTRGRRGIFAPSALPPRAPLPPLHCSQQRIKKSPDPPLFRRKTWFFYNLPRPQGGTKRGKQDVFFIFWGPTFFPVSGNAGKWKTRISAPEWPWRTRFSDGSEAKSQKHDAKPKEFSWNPWI